MKRIICWSLLISSLLVSLQAAAFTTCTIKYQMKGWSFIYKEYRGQGVVTCLNGQTANVRIISRGAGLTMGKSEIDFGEGVISDVMDISEVYGNYVFLDTHAGAVRSVEGVVMTKGEVSLALKGIGRGVDIGASMGVFSILPAQ